VTIDDTLPLRKKVTKGRGKGLIHRLLRLLSAGCFNGVAAMEEFIWEQAAVHIAKLDIGSVRGFTRGQERQ